MLNRDQLPALAGVAYLNTGTNGPIPQASLDAMREELEYNGREARIGMPYFERFLAGRDRARAAAARAVGAPPEEIALTSSTTQGVGLVTSGLDWQAGDEIVTTTEEHPGILSPVDVLARRFGVVVRAVEGGAVVDAVGPRTRMVAISHVLWTTGRTLELPPIAEAVHAHGGVLLVDGAQSAGNIVLRVPETGADYYAFSGQKWLLGPQGSGGLWVHPDRIAALWPALSGYLALDHGEIGAFKTTAAKVDGGSADPVTVTGFAAAMEWVESQPGGRDAWIARAHEHAAAARERLAQVPGVGLGIDSGNGLIAFTLDGHEDTAALAGALAERGVLTRFIPGTPWMRISIGSWTSEEDVERLAVALTEV